LEHLLDLVPLLLALEHLLDLAPLLLALENLLDLAPLLLSWEPLLDMAPILALMMNLRTVDLQLSLETGKNLLIFISYK
jgi:hypothetical protein